MSIVSKETFFSAFPLFRRERQAVLNRLLDNGVHTPFVSGTGLYHDGDRCRGIGFLLSGEIRVFKIGESGREITLYDIFPGETCILNASCLLSGQPYPANATGAADGAVLFVPGHLFKSLMAESETLRAFIFSIFSRRFHEVIELLEEVTFGKLSERLMDYLLEKSANDLLYTSHQNIANDLGSSREVISRLLKDFERRGQVSLSRNKIQIINS